MRNECSEKECHKKAFGRGLCSAHYQKARYHGVLPEAPGPRSCAQCGNDFTSRKWNAAYCSRKCNEAARYERTRKPEFIATTCEHCGKDLPADRRTDVRFCTRKCSQDHRNVLSASERRTAKLSNRQPCRGCLGSIPDDRKSSAQYCSDECKIKSRRHEAYGLTHDELRQLLAQHEVCAVCGTADWGRKGPCVDHDHATGKVRGILCKPCNTGLGCFRDDPARLRTAITYLGG